MRELKKKNVVWLMRCNTYKMSNKLVRLPRLCVQTFVLHNHGSSCIIFSFSIKTPLVIEPKHARRSLWIVSLASKRHVKETDRWCGEKNGMELGCI